MPQRYEIDGRLADVIAAVTVLAAAPESEGTVALWARRLSRPADDAADGQSVAHWAAVFSDHREFFLTYEWEGAEKAALRIRYANKTLDRATRQPVENYQALNAQQRGDLTSAPLDATTTSALVTTALSLHAATLARKADARFYFQTVGPAVLALIGGLLGALLPIVLKPPAPPAPPPAVAQQVRPVMNAAFGANAPANESSNSLAQASKSRSTVHWRQHRSLALLQQPDAPQGTP